jgi:ppGpp synthetase/RelA/SpoT-type nucleotidyltranferase
MLDNAIRATFQWRYKDETRLAGKVERKRKDLDAAGTPEPATVDLWLAALTDLAAVRVLTYEESDRAAAAGKIAEQFTDATCEAGATPVIRDVVNHATGKFYRATHLLVTLPKDDLAPHLSNLEGVVCEVQVCSLLAHVWNEIEHDLVYKQLSGSPSGTEINLLRALGNETLAGDAVISELIRATNARSRTETEVFVDVHDFVSRSRGLFPLAIAFPENAGQLFLELLRMGCDSPEKVKALIGDPPDTGARELFDGLLASLTNEERDLLKLKADSSDLMLMKVLASKAQDIIDAHPTGRGIGRPPRIASIARRFRDMP